MRIGAWELSGTEDNPGGGRLTTTWMRNEGKTNNKLRETGKALREAQNTLGKLDLVCEGSASDRNAREER
jgi:hypothetical protein